MSIHGDKCHQLGNIPPCDTSIYQFMVINVTNILYITELIGLHRTKSAICCYFHSSKWL